MRLCFTIAVTLLIGATAAHAQEWPRFEVTVGGQLADFQTDLKLDASATIIGGSYRFAIVSTPVMELGPLFGVLAINLSTGIDLSGFVSGAEDEASDEIERDAAVTAPAVLPGAFVSLRAHPRLTIRARAGYISADFGNIDGQIFMAQGGADVRIGRWLGVGGSYAYNRLSAGVDGNEFRGRLRYTFSGPQIYALFSF